MAKKKLGIGDVCSALKRYLHLQKNVDEKYPNAIQCDPLEEIIVVYKGVIKFNHNDQVCIFFNTMTSLTNNFIVLNNIQGL